MKNTTKLFLLLTAIISFAFANPNPTEAKQINVVIDAGHGGHDSGATSNDASEKIIVAQITNKIKSLNKNKNVVLHFTRNSDAFLSLKERTDIINNINPDLVLSLHVNSNKNKDKSGVELFVFKDSQSYKKSNEIAVNLNEKLVKNHNFKVSEIKNAPFFILKKSNAPAIILELGYLSNDEDKKYLTDENQQIKIAESILEFVSDLK
ncbi:N-acetylmuramoyl-L-alanine amidase [Flavobacterium sp.]|uniref:N-acetylmuramoyl-L-alanine amidase family protein n=1 Tax=Flavobacterium sp. TaxID=239 RepID=UPI00286CB77D|nr:N-acetylmuramoyl-L-alanine amidase [Flavobacterium sp.]